MPLRCVFERFRVVLLDVPHQLLTHLSSCFFVLNGITIKSWFGCCLQASNAALNWAAEADLTVLIMGFALFWFLFNI